MDAKHTLVERFGNVTGPYSQMESHHKGLSMQSFAAIFILNKLLKKQPSCWLFEMPWHSSNITLMVYKEVKQ